MSEAHPDDEWQMESNRKEKVVFKQPKSFAERLEAAKILVERLHYKAPVAIDSMDNLAGHGLLGLARAALRHRSGRANRLQGGHGSFRVQAGRGGEGSRGLSGREPAQGVASALTGSASLSPGA